LGRLEQAEGERRALVLARARNVERGVQGACRSEQLRQQHIVASFARLLTPQGELGVRGDEIASASEGDPSSKRGRFRCDPGEAKPKTRSQAGISKLEEIAQVRTYWAKDCLRSRVVLALCEFCGQ
jgi:hypothetical protein